MSRNLDTAQVLASLRATGERLERDGFPGLARLVIAGGTAGLLAGELKAPRTTGDCDVLWAQGFDEERWKRIESAAESVAIERELPKRWLNRDCQMHMWCLMLGWEARCEPVDRFGPLEVVRLSRIDLMASKLVSTPKRPQDLEDIRSMKPTHEEVSVMEKHLNRLEEEDLDGADCAKQRAILKLLGSAIRDGED